VKCNARASTWLPETPGHGCSWGWFTRGQTTYLGCSEHFQGGEVPVSAPALAVSAGCGFDDGCLNEFLAAALLRVVRDAVPVQAPASASIVPSATVRGFDTGVLGGFDSGGAGPVCENSAACKIVQHRVHVIGRTPTLLIARQALACGVERLHVVRSPCQGPTDIPRTEHVHS